MTFLLVAVTGVPTVEAQMKDRPEYQAYMRRTHMFIPWFNKIASSESSAEGRKLRRNRDDKDNLVDDQEGAQERIRGRDRDSERMEQDQDQNREQDQEQEQARPQDRTRDQDRGRNERSSRQREGGERTQDTEKSESRERDQPRDRNGTSQRREGKPVDAEGSRRRVVTDAGQ